MYVDIPISDRQMEMKKKERNCHEFLCHSSPISSIVTLQLIRRTNGVTNVSHHSIMSHLHWMKLPQFQIEVSEVIQIDFNVDIVLVGVL